VGGNQGDTHLIRVIVKSIGGMDFMRDGTSIFRNRGVLRVRKKLPEGGRSQARSVAGADFERRLLVKDYSCGRMVCRRNLHTRAGRVKLQVSPSLGKKVTGCVGGGGQARKGPVKG